MAPIELNDLGLKKSFSIHNASSSMSTYNDLMIKVCLQMAIRAMFIDLRRVCSLLLSSIPT